MTSTTNNQAALIYKIATRDAFAAAEGSGEFTGMPIDVADGFIHFSTAAQVGETLSLHFKGASDLVLMAVRSADVAADLVWETSRGGQLFPHLYRPFPMAAVEWSAAISVAADGSCALPPDVH